jgi:hypothetical protein
MVLMLTDAKRHRITRVSLVILLLPRHQLGGAAARQLWRWRRQLGGGSLAVALAAWQGGNNMAVVAAARRWRQRRQNGGG